VRIALSLISDSGCTGGYTITITIVPEHSAPVTLNGYDCANQLSGNIGGDPTGFLSSAGVSL
jgi:hypothetical protein